MKPANPYPPYPQTSYIGKATVGVQKETRGSMATTTKQYTEAEQNACSLDAMLNAGLAILVSDKSN